MAAAEPGEVGEAVHRESRAVSESADPFSNLAMKVIGASSAAQVPQRRCQRVPSCSESRASNAPASRALTPYVK